jgi:hypothetical protein
MLQVVLSAKLEYTALNQLHRSRERQVMVTQSGNATHQLLHPIGKLYAHWAFNFVIDIARAIADDFVERPQHYKILPKEVTNILSGFRSLLGSHPDWPDTHQRISLFRNLGAACLAGVPLREAALLCVEAGTEVNRHVLIDAFRDSVASFRNQITTLEGQSLEFSCHQIDMIFDNAVRLFRSEDIMRVFNLAAAPKGENWPFARPGNGDGTNLATELIRALDAGNVARALLGGPGREVGVPKPRPIGLSMTQNKFILLQHAACYGALAISGTMADSGPQSDLQQLIGNTYKWTKALQRLIPDVVRVWKDPSYRMRLTDIEWGMIEPHPSGDIRLALAGGGGTDLRFSTATVRGEVCCCTGDLPCPSSSNCEISPGPSCINCGSLAVVQCGVLSPV